ncbi:hypothetical protein SOPP22_18425 [Shewanella sp. OPT22]|nr:hypothetical protein SOPP22_18425 [Shewanella sp. OPT22]
MESSPPPQLLVTSDTYQQDAFQCLTENDPIYFRVELNKTFQVTVLVKKLSDSQVKMSVHKFHAECGYDIEEEVDKEAEIEKIIKTKYKVRVQSDALRNGSIRCTDPKVQIHAENCLMLLSHCQSPEAACQFMRELKMANLEYLEQPVSSIDTESECVQEHLTTKDKKERIPPLIFGERGLIFIALRNIDVAMKLAELTGSKCNTLKTKALAAAFNYHMQSERNQDSSAMMRNSIMSATLSFIQQNHSANLENSQIQDKKSHGLSSKQLDLLIKASGLSIKAFIEDKALEPFLLNALKNDPINTLKLLKHSDPKFTHEVYYRLLSHVIYDEKVSDKLLVCIIHAYSETGVIKKIALWDTSYSRLCHQKILTYGLIDGIRLHRPKMASFIENTCLFTANDIEPRTKFTQARELDLQAIRLETPQKESQEGVRQLRGIANIHLEFLLRPNVTFEDMHLACKYSPQKIFTALFNYLSQDSEISTDDATQLLYLIFAMSLSHCEMSPEKLLTAPSNNENSPEKTLESAKKEREAAVVNAEILFSQLKQKRFATSKINWHDVTWQTYPNMIERVIKAQPESAS